MTLSDSSGDDTDDVADMGGPLPEPWNADYPIDDGAPINTDADAGAARAGLAALQPDASQPNGHDPSFGDAVLNAAEKIWDLPNTLIGLGAGIAGLPFGARPSLEHGAIVFNDYPFGPGGAMTLGDTILSTEHNLNQPIPNYAWQYSDQRSPPTSDDMVNMGSHEEGHVHQADALGPFYLPAYAVQGILSTGPSPMEKAADTYGQTGQGWWPW